MPVETISDFIFGSELFHKILPDNIVIPKCSTKPEKAYIQLKQLIIN